MPEPFAPAASDVAGLIREALRQGATVIIPRPPGQHHSPPPDNGASLAMTFRWLFEMTRAESKALAALLEHEHITKQELHTTMSLDGRPVSKIRIVNVVVCRLRRKLAPHGVEIATVWGEGYSIDQENYGRIEKLLAGHGVELRPRATPIETGPNPV